MSEIAEKAIQSLKNGHLFLEASAGTGKTYSIIEIVKSILRSNVELERIAVITFTEKAAGELSERIRSGLEEEIQKHPKNPVFIHNLEKLPFANIGTIHQFCRNLLARNPESSDFFSLKDEERNIQPKIKKAFSEFLEMEEARAIAEKKEEEFIQFFYDFEVDILEDFCIEMIQKTKTQKFALLEQVNEEEVQSQFQSLLNHVLQISPKSKLANTIKENKIDVSLFDVLKGGKFLKEDYSLNRTTNSDIKTIPQFEDWSNQLKELKPKLDFILKLPSIHSLINFINRFIDYFVKFQLKESFISTDGIIQSTKTMLQDFPDTRKRISSEFDYLIVDECQDTDPDQFMIFQLLAEPQEKNATTPKLIFVGDKKQSIYKFRNADLQAVSETISKLVPKENTIALDTSYRGTHYLTQGFNLIFSHLESKSFVYKEVKAGRDDEVALSPTPCIYLSFSNSDDEIKTDLARDLCYDKIGNFISYVKGNSDFLIWDKSIKSKRISKYSDIAVLAYSRRDLSNLQKFLLSRNIPCSIYKEKDYYEDPIVNALSYILHSIENPNDSASFFFALQSPFFLISAPLLSKLSENNILNYTSDLSYGSEFTEVFSIFRAFRKARSERYMYSASYIIQRLLEEFDCISKIASGFEGRKNLTNLYHYYEILDELQYTHSYSFGELAREMKNRVQSKLEGERKIDFEEKDPNQDAVRLMTIHSAKGLEFPICIMLSLFKNKNYKKERLYLYREEKIQQLIKKGEFSLNTTNSIQTFGYNVTANLQSQETEEEEERVFYVGLTRARDYLFLPLIFPSEIKRFTSFSKKVQELFQEKSDLVNTLLSQNIARIFDNKISKKTSEEKQNKKIEKINPDSLLNKIPDFTKIDSIGSYKIISYSSLHTKDHTKNKPEIVAEKGKNETPEEYPRFGAEFGQACHEVLELIPLELISQPKKLDKELKKLCSEIYKTSGIATKNLDYNEEKLFELSKKALLHKYKIDENLTQMSDWQYITKERKFYSPGEKLGDLLLGIGDIFFYYNNKYYILDWKTDNYIHPEGFLAHSFDRYKNQMYIYSWILVKNLALTKGKNTLKDWEEFYKKEFGGMLYVYLRHLDHPDGVVFVKLPSEEVIQFIT